MAKALNRFFSETPHWSFLFVGPDFSKGEVSARIKEEFRNFQDRIQILPALPHDELFPLIEFANFVALPSLALNSALRTAANFPPVEKQRIGQAARDRICLLDPKIVSE